MTHYEKLIEALEEYVDMGLTCIPLRGKTPLMNRLMEYRDTKPDFETQLKLFEAVKGQVTGIGICTGKFHDLSVLDLEVEEDLSKHKLPLTPTVESGSGGRHYYFDFPEDINEFDSRIPLQKYGIEGDLLLNRGYCVAPPSLHPETNKEYKWLVPFRNYREELPDFYLSLITSHSKTSGRTDWKEVELEEVTEGTRHTTAVRLVGKMLHSFPRSDWDELIPPLLLGWNENSCVPPMDEKEVMGIYHSLTSKHTSGGNALENSPNDKNNYHRTTSTLSIEELLSLSEESKPEFVIDKLIPENGITYMFGHPGCGKSWLMLEMARAIAGGTPFLDAYMTKQRNIMIVDEESGLWEMRRRAELLGIDSKLPIFFHCQNGFKFDNESSVTNLIKVCKELGVTMVVFDPFVAMHSGEENSATEMQKVMDSMQKFTLENITVMFIHHSRKGGFGRGSQNSRGSSAIHGRADSTLIVDKQTHRGHECIDVSHSKSRRGKTQEPFRSVIAQDSEGGPIKLLYDGNITESVKQVEKARKLIKEILLTGKLKRQEIIDLLSTSHNMGRNNTQAALTDMEKAGDIVSCLVGRQKEFSLPED